MKVRIAISKAGRRYYALVLHGRYRDCLVFLRPDIVCELLDVRYDDLLGLDLGDYDIILK